MFRNYWKTTLRNLWKNKTSTGINLLGLTTGLSCCLLIGLYMQHELSYDNFQKNGERTARVIMEYSFGGDVKRGNFTSTKVAPAFKREFPEVELSIRMQQYARIVQKDDKLFDEKKIPLRRFHLFRHIQFQII